MKLPLRRFQNRNLILNQKPPAGYPLRTTSPLPCRFALAFPLGANFEPGGSVPTADSRFRRPAFVIAQQTSNFGGFFQQQAQQDQQEDVLRW
jgi:hypothetical protein